MTSSQLSPDSVYAQEASAAPAQGLAQLPAQLLHIAAQFASSDPAKAALCNIHIEQQDDKLRIASTNGHYAFRVVLDADPERCSGAWLNVPELALPAATFKKRSPYALQALIRADGEARLYGAKRGQLVGLLEARPCGDVSGAYGHPFPPSFDQLWPDTFRNAPGAPVAVNASYLGDICAIVARYSEKSFVSWQCNAATTPLLYTAIYDAAPCDGVKLEFLLMPVQVRY